MTLHSTIEIPNTPQTMYADIARRIKPRRFQSVSQFADDHIVIPASVSPSAAGNWVTDRNPILRAPMDALSPLSPVAMVVLMFPAQFGKSQVGLNWVMSVIAQDPKMMLIAQSDLPNCIKFVTTKLQQMINANPKIAGRIRAEKEQRDGVDTKLMKNFIGGGLIIGGVKTPSSLRMVTTPYQWGDEVDEWADFASQGDVLDIFSQRKKSAGRRAKQLFTSTPVSHDGLIETLYSETDMRELWVECPSCGDLAKLDLFVDEKQDEIRVDIDNKGRAYWAAPCCGTAIAESHKPQMLARHQWIANAPNVALKQGYQANALAFPPGMGDDWRAIFDSWRKCKSSTPKKKTFVQTTAARGWKDARDEIQGSSLLARVEIYDPDKKFDIITGFADLQADRAELTVVGWVDDCDIGTPWALDHIIIEGDPTTPELYADIRKNAAAAGVNLMGIDSGNWSKHVYDAVAQHSWMIATKGMSNRKGVPLVEDRLKRTQRLRRRLKSGYAPEIIGTDNAKAIVFSRARRPLELPGALHFPNDPAFDQEYFDQLAGETFKPITKAGRTEHRWVKNRERNEALDTMVGNFAIKALAAQMPGKRASTATNKNPRRSTRPQNRAQRKTRGRLRT